MIKVTLVGKGNVSSHLEKVFENSKDVHLVNILSSRGNEIKKALQTESTDIYIIAVSDDAIDVVSQQFMNSEKIIVHTSGSVSMQTLPEGIRRGVFYPLQTFSKNRKIDFKSIPICIEAEKSEDLKLLHKLATSISESVYEISSVQRKSLHLAAVFANNFTNHLYHIGNDICQANGVSFDILKPLILETSEKINELSPIEAQTGPAKRNDEKTIKKQLNQLQNHTHKEVYKTMTKSIIETYGKKL